MFQDPPVHEGNLDSALRAYLLKALDEQKRVDFGVTLEVEVRVGVSSDQIDAHALTANCALPTSFACRPVSGSFVSGIDGVVEENVAKWFEQIRGDGKMTNGINWSDCNHESTTTLVETWNEPPDKFSYRHVRTATGQDSEFDEGTANPKRRVSVEDWALPTRRMDVRMALSLEKTAGEKPTGANKSATRKRVRTATSWTGVHWEMHHTSVYLQSGQVFIFDGQELELELMSTSVEKLDSEDDRDCMVEQALYILDKILPLSPDSVGFKPRQIQETGEQTDKEGSKKHAKLSFDLLPCWPRAANPVPLKRTHLTCSGIDFRTYVIGEKTDGTRAFLRTSQHGVEINIKGTEYLISKDVFRDTAKKVMCAIFDGEVAWDQKSLKHVFVAFDILHYSVEGVGEGNLSKYPFEVRDELMGTAFENMVSSANVQVVMLTDPHESMPSLRLGIMRKKWHSVDAAGLHNLKELMSNDCITLGDVVFRTDGYILQSKLAWYGVDASGGAESVYKFKSPRDLTIDLELSLVWNSRRDGKMRLICVSGATCRSGNVAADMFGMLMIDKLDLARISNGVLSKGVDKVYCELEYRGAAWRHRITRNNKSASNAIKTVGGTMRALYDHLTEEEFLARIGSPNTRMSGYPL